MAIIASLVCFTAFLAPSIDQPDTMVSASDKHLFVSCRRLKTLAIYDRQTTSGKPKLKLAVPVTGDIKAQGAFSNGKFAILYALDNMKVWRTLIWDGKLHALPDIPYGESVDGHKEAFLSYVKMKDDPTFQVSFMFGDGVRARAAYLDDKWKFDRDPHGNNPVGSFNLSYSDLVMKDDEVKGVQVFYSGTSSVTKVAYHKDGISDWPGQVLRDNSRNDAAILFDPFDSTLYRLLSLRCESTKGKLYQVSIPVRLQGSYEYGRLEYCSGKLYIWQDCYRRVPLKMQYVREVKVG